MAHIQSFADQVDDLRERYFEPELTLVTTTIIPVERNDVPGRVCPLTGSTDVRGLEVIDDLATIIHNESGARKNRWELEEPEDLQRFDDLAAKAVDYREGYGDIIHAPIVFATPAEAVPGLLDDETQVIFDSGGWRSGKTYRGMQWWCRGWVKFGQQGERFWLLGPKMANSYRLLQKAFYGTAEVPPIMPARKIGKKIVPVLARNTPRRHTLRDMSFEFVDGSVGDCYHAAGHAQMEGESVRRVQSDEMWAAKDARAYDIARGRVMQCEGQVRIASVPDEECVWLYEKVVAEYERTKHSDDCQFRVSYLSGFDNPWVATRAVERMLKGEPDPVVADNKIRGLWTRRGLYAYTDVWDEAKHSRDELSHSADAWGLGDDITAHVGLRHFRHEGATYLGGIDPSEGGDKPHTRLWARVFGKAGDWSTWTLVILDEESTNADAKQAAAESARRKNGRYLDAAIVMDKNGCNDASTTRTNARSTSAKRYYRNKGFKCIRAPARWPGKDGRRGASRNPEVGMSRTVVRDLLRRGRLMVNAGACPGTMGAMLKAPNRRKRDGDKNSWIEKQVYAYEDCIRYLVWRIFAKHVEERIRDTEEQADSLTEQDAA